MNWEAIGAVGEIIGALAVVSSLIFVGWQLRQNTLAIKTSTSQTHIEGYNSIAVNVLHNKEVAHLWRTGLDQGLTSLDDDDKVRFISLLSALYRYYDASYLQYLQKSLEPDLWNSIEQQVKQVSRTTGFSDWWATRSHWHSERFRTLVHDAMQSNDTAPIGYGAPENTDLTNNQV